MIYRALLGPVGTWTVCPPGMEVIVVRAVYIKLREGHDRNKTTLLPSPREVLKRVKPSYP